MGRNQWQNAESANELMAMGVSARPGRGWRIFALLLGIGAVSFVGAYYVPLFRAHQKLSTEYTQLSQAATGDRQKLATTVKALETTSAERDTLRTAQRGIDQEKSARAQRLEKFQREIESKMSGAISRKQLRVERREDVLDVTLTSNSLVSTGGDGLADGAKKLLCQLADTGKVFGPLHYELRGLAKPGADNWSEAVGRAGSAADMMTGDCKVDAKSVVALASGADQAKAGGGVLLVRIEGKPGGAAGAAGQ